MGGGSTQKLAFRLLHDYPHNIKGQQLHSNLERFFNSNKGCAIVGGTFTTFGRESFLNLVILLTVPFSGQNRQRGVGATAELIMVAVFSVIPKCVKKNPVKARSFSLCVEVELLLHCFQRSSAAGVPLGPHSIKLWQNIVKILEQEKRKPCWMGLIGLFPPSPQHSKQA